MDKRESYNHIIAQWKAYGYQFQGGVYHNIYEGQDYQDAARVSNMMTWHCLCATHGKEAMLADVDSYYVLVVCVLCMLCNCLYVLCMYMQC